MEISMKRFVSGFKEETYVGTFQLTVRSVISYKTEDNVDVRDTSPSTAKMMVEETKKRIEEAIRKEILTLALKEFKKDEEDGVVATPLVKNKLILAHPAEYAKMMRKVETRREPIKTKKEVNE